MFKKIALIVAFVIATLGMGYLIYRFFFATAPTTTPPPTGSATSTPGGGLPSSGGAQPPTGGGTTGGGTGLPTASNLPTVASGGPTATPTVGQGHILGQVKTSAGGGLNYYDSDDGKFYRRLADGTTQALSSNAFRSASDVTFAPDGNKAIVAFPDDSKIVFDFTTQKQTSLPKHWQDPTFNADGSSVLAKSMSLDPANRWLVSTTSDGASAKLIEPLGDNADKVTISVSPNDAVVAFADTGDPVGFDARDMLLIGQNHENLKSLRVEGFGFLPQWAPDGGHLLYSASAAKDSYAPTLWVVAADGSSVGAQRVDLGIHTWADKCVFADAQTVYCAVPDTLPDGAGLQRDIAATTPDGIYRIDLSSGSSRLIGRPAESTPINDLSVSSDGSTLFFVDDQSRLKEMRLR